MKVPWPRPHRTREHSRTTARSFVDGLHRGNRRLKFSDQPYARRIDGFHEHRAAKVDLVERALCGGPVALTPVDAALARGKDRGDFSAINRLRAEGFDQQLHDPFAAMKWMNTDPCDSADRHAYPAGHRELHRAIAAHADEFVAFEDADPTFVVTHGSARLRGVGPMCQVNSAHPSLFNVVAAVARADWVDCTEHGPRHRRDGAHRAVGGRRANH